jgi:asparagine synthase (glutamine-hydrolysing)
LQHYLTLDYVPTPYSIFKNIHKLEPGNFIIVQNNVIEKKKYWDATFSELSISFDEACHQFESKFEKAVSTKLLSDVPLGFFLSGGLDSSSVAYFAQKNSTQKIKTYSVGFEDKSYDESNYAKQVAHFIGSDHHSEVLTEREALSLIPIIGQKMDEPFADASIIPTYLLTKFTRKHVTVALGGDGSDELLAGYPTFLADKFIRPARALSYLLTPALELFLKALPVSDRDIGLDFKIQQFKKGIGVPPDYTHTSWLSSFTPDMAENLWAPAYRQAFKSHKKLDIITEHLKDLDPGLNQFIRNTFIYYKTYLPDDILVKVDRASMLSSLEVRSPFLDYTLVEFINSLPKKFKQKGFKSKRILKKAMEGKLPDNIINRPKKGFGIPLSLWLRKDLRKLCDELLSESSLGHHGYFNYSFIKKLKDDHYQQKSNNRKLLWNLMMFQLWYLNYGR